MNNTRGMCHLKKPNLLLQKYWGQINSRHAWCHSFPNLLSPCLLCRDIDIKSYKTVIFFCGFVCVLTSWCTLREEHASRVFDNRVLRRIFQLKREKVTEGWRKFHNEEIHNLYSSPDIFKWSNRGGCDGWGRGEMCIRIFVARREGTRPLEKLLYGWEDNIKMYFTERAQIYGFDSTGDYSHIL